MSHSTPHSVTPPSPATTRGEQARQQLLQAAIELFGELGLKGATTRDIAQRAGQNIAAITYYFNSKEGLYLAVAQYIADLSSRRSHRWHKKLITFCSCLLSTSHRNSNCTIFVKGYWHSAI